MSIVLEFSLWDSSSDLEVAFDARQVCVVPKTDLARLHGPIDIQTLVNIIGSPAWDDEAYSHHRIRAQNLLSMEIMIDKHRNNESRETRSAGSEPYGVGGPGRTSKLGSLKASLSRSGIYDHKTSIVDYLGWKY